MTNTSKWACAELQFLIEQPTLTIEHMKLNIIDALRITIDLSGRIRSIEIGDEWGVNTEPMSRLASPVLWDAIVTYCEMHDAELIIACLLEHKRDKPNRIADARNAWREAV